MYWGNLHFEPWFWDYIPEGAHSPVFEKQTRNPVENNEVSSKMLVDFRSYFSCVYSGPKHKFGVISTEFDQWFSR